MATGARSRLEREPDLIPRITGMLRAGHYVNVACDTVGVAESSFYAWLERGEAVLEKLRGSDDPDKAKAELEEKEQRYAEFAESVKRATGNAEERALKVIRDAMPETWQAAAWYLERRYPRRWGRLDRVEATRVNPTDDALVAAAMEDEDVRAAIDDLIAKVSMPEESCDAPE